MQYLKIWLSFREVIEPLTNEETGSLFRMMLDYAESGTQPLQFVGNERFVWAFARQAIDAAEAKVETLRQNGMKGGRPKATESKEKQEKANESKAKQEKANESLNVNVNVNVKDKVKDNVIKERFARFWTEYPRKTAKETALRAFVKLQPDEELLSVMLTAIKKQKQTAQWQEDGGRFIPHPATWLNQKRWEDDVVVSKPNSAAGFPQRDYSDVPNELLRGLAAEINAMKGAS